MCLNLLRGDSHQVPWNVLGGYPSSVPPQDEAKYLESFVPGSQHHVAMVCTGVRDGRQYFFQLHAVRANPLPCPALPPTELDKMSIGDLNVIKKGFV